MKSSLNKKETGLFMAFMIKNGVKSLHNLLIQFSLLAKKAVVFAYKRRHTVLERLYLIYNFVNAALTGIYQRVRASSQRIDLLAYLPVFRSLVLKLVTFQLFKRNSQPQETETTSHVISKQYIKSFTFFSHRIQLSISKEQQEEQATTSPAEDHHPVVANSPQKSKNTNNPVSPVKTIVPTLHPPKSPGLNALAKFSKMDTTPRSKRTQGDDACAASNDNKETVHQHKNSGETIPAVLFP